MTDRFKIDWEAVTRKALNFHAQGPVIPVLQRWFRPNEGEARAWIDELAASYVETVKRNREWPSLAELRDRHRAIASTGAKMRELIGGDQTYEHFITHLDDAIRCAEIIAERARKSIGTEPPMVAESRRLFIGGFLEEWINGGGEFTGPHDRGPAFRAAIEIMCHIPEGSMAVS